MCMQNHRTRGDARAAHSGNLKGRGLGSGRILSRRACRTLSVLALLCIVSLASGWNFLSRQVHLPRWGLGRGDSAGKEGARMVEELSKEERKKLKNIRKKEAREVEAKAEKEREGKGAKKKRRREEEASDELEEGEVEAPRPKKDVNQQSRSKSKPGANKATEEDTSSKLAFLSLLKSSTAKPAASRYESVTWRKTEYPRTPQKVSEVRQLFLSTLGVRGEDASTTWEVPRLSEVARVAVLIVDGMGNSTVKEHRKEMPFLASLEPHCAILRCPGSKIEVFPLMGELLTCPARSLSTPEPNRKNGKKGTLAKSPIAIRGDAQQIMGAGEICLTEAELCENGYPGYTDRIGGGEDEESEEGEGVVVAGGVMCPVVGAPAVPEGHVCSDKSKAGEGPADRLLAMDCEMVTTKEGLELARVTIVDSGREVLIDELVVPTNEILDYNTKYSGITEELLKGVTTSLKDIQKRLLKLVRPGDILIGHSLENDFKACRFVHRRVIDTSVLYPHQKGGPYKNALRYLVSKYLNREMDRKDGHCSAEDAQAVMDLVNLKLQRGHAFGRGSGDNKIEGESLFRLMSRQEPAIPSVMVGNAGSLSRFASGGVSCVTCTSDSELVSKMGKACKEAKGGLVLGVVDTLDKGDEPAARAAVDKLVKEVGDGLPGGTLFVVLGTNEDLRAVSGLRQRRKASLTGKSAGMPWTADDEVQLCNEVLRARNGFCLVTVVR